MPDDVSPSESIEAAESSPPAAADAGTDADAGKSAAAPADPLPGETDAGVDAESADPTAAPDAPSASPDAPSASPDTPSASPGEPTAEAGEESGQSLQPAQPASAPPASVAPASAPPASAPPAPAARGLCYAVDIVFCIDVTGSMTPVIDAVKANALRFYEDVQTNLTAKGKNVDELRVRVIAFRDFTEDAETAVQESSFFPLPDEQTAFSAFVSHLAAEGGGDTPESGLEALALAINSPWTSRGDRRRQVIVVWTDAPAHPLNFAELPPDLASSVPTNFSALTDLWEDPQGPVGASSKRLILFAPDGAGWSDISANWENVVHHPSQAGGGLSDVDYGTIVDSIGNSV
jgi:hypothetical protein